MSVSTIEIDMYVYASGKRKVMAYVVKTKKGFVKKYSKKELRDLNTYINKL